MLVVQFFLAIALPSNSIHFNFLSPSCRDLMFHWSKMSEGGGEGGGVMRTRVAGKMVDRVRIIEKDIPDESFTTKTEI